MNGIIGIKTDQTQKFLEDGTRIPVTLIMASGVLVSAVKTKEKNGYNSVQLCMGFKKKASKALLGQVKGGDKAPRFFREIRLDAKDEAPNVGDAIKATDVLKPGDIIDVSGVSKGKGYAGVVKRHHFKGGPRTHGQSDRERAPGSIGQTTTPGRVYKGKRMAGNMGNDNVTIKNLKVVDVLEDSILIEGLVPGGKNRLVVIEKVGEDKKFVPLYKGDNSVGQLPHVSDDARQPIKEQLEESSSSLSERRLAESSEKSENKTESAFSSSENGQSPNIQEEKSKEVKEDKEENAKQ